MATRKLGSTKKTDTLLLTSVNLASEITGVLGVSNGGTGQSTYTDGQLLIGNTTGNTLTKSTLTSGDNVLITNGGGSITLSSPTPLKNKILNGNFDIWQRGAGPFAGNIYNADGWAMLSVGSTVSVVRSSFALGQTDVPGNPEFYVQVTVTSVAGAGNYAILRHPIEDVSTLSGGPAVLSFWAKTFTSNKNISVELSQFFGSGGSPSAQVNTLAGKITLTTSFQKFELPVTIPSVSGKTLGSDGTDRLQLQLWLDAGSTYNTRTDTLGQQSGDFVFSRVQLEEGSIATEFELRPVVLETMLCQRYFEYVYVTTRDHAAGAGSIMQSSGFFKASKRATPTLTAAGGSTANLSSLVTEGANINGFVQKQTAAGAGEAYAHSYAWAASAEL